MLNKLIKLVVPNLVFLMETRLKYHEAIKVRDNSVFLNGFVMECEGERRHRKGGLCLF